jgi:hypothetical protein
MQMFDLFRCSTHEHTNLVQATVKAAFQVFGSSHQTNNREGEKTMSADKRKLRSSHDHSRSPGTSLTEPQRLRLQQASEPAGNGYLVGTSFKNSEVQSQTADIEMGPLSLAAELEANNVFAFYPSSADPSEAGRPTLADAVIEHLRQLRLRQRPH